MSEKEIELPEGLNADKAFDVLQEYDETEDAQIVSTDTLETKDETIDEFAGVFRDVLSEMKDLREETVNAMSIDALASEFRDEEGDIDIDTLAQFPESQSGGSENEDEGFDADTLSRDTVNEIEEVKSKMDSLEKRGIEGRTDTLKADIVDLAGAEDYEEVEKEVLD